MKCGLCEPPPVYKDWHIDDSEFWTIYIHPNQSYLGRCFAVLNRHAEDFFDITGDEMKDYFSIAKKLRDAVQKIFQPDMLNYAILGNDKRHVHMNFVPRYSSSRNFGGLVFEDKRWGENYSPYDKSFKIPEKTLFAIRDTIKAKLHQK